MAPNFQLPLYKQNFNPLGNKDFTRVKEFVAFLKNRQFYLRDTGIDPRLYNQWKKFGLLGEIKTGERKWVTLNFGEYLWLKIIEDLRMFGLPLEDIKRIKERFTVSFYDAMVEVMPDEKIEELLVNITNAFPDIPDEERELFKQKFKDKQFVKEMMNGIATGPSNIFEMAIFHMVVMEKEAALVIILTNHLPGVPEPEIRSDAISVPGKRKKTKRQSLIEFFIDSEEFNVMQVDHDSLEIVRHTPHIRIPLRVYIKEFIGEIKNERHLENSLILNHDELVLLRELRKNHVTEITVRMNPASENSSGSINRIEVTSNLKKDAEARLVETFTNREYADIVYKVADGKIVSFKKTIKIKP